MFWVKFYLFYPKKEVKWIKIRKNKRRALKQTFEDHFICVILPGGEEMSTVKQYGDIDERQRSDWLVILGDYAIPGLTP